MAGHSLQVNRPLRSPDDHDHNFAAAKTSDGPAAGPDEDAPYTPRTPTKATSAGVAVMIEGGVLPRVSARPMPNSLSCGELRRRGNMAMVSRLAVLPLRKSVKVSAASMAVMNEREAGRLSMAIKAGSRGEARRGRNQDGAAAWDCRRTCGITIQHGGA